MRATKIERIMADRLVLGDSFDTVEKFLKEQDWHYAYDRDLHRFQVINSEKNELPKIFGRSFIFIYMDDNHKFKSFEVVKHFPGIVF